jgi:hypothetical protein
MAPSWSSPDWGAMAGGAGDGDKGGEEAGVCKSTRGFSELLEEVAMERAALLLLLLLLLYVGGEVLVGVAGSGGRSPGSRSGGVAELEAGKSVSTLAP